MEESQKYFIQALMSARQMEEGNVKKVMGEGDLLTSIQNINSKLSVVNLKIVKTVCEITDQIFFCLVPITYKEETFKQNRFKENEMYFFKKLLLYIVETGTGTIRDDIIEQLSDECNLTGVTSESTIKRLIDCKYLSKVDDGVAVTPLCVSEFSTFLKLNFKEVIVLCKLCQSITINGIRCSSCDTPVHKHCLSKLFQHTSHHSKKCPNCKEPWQEADLQIF